MQTVDEPTFVRQPAGRMVLGPRWVYGSPDGKLFFSIVFGAIDERELAGLTRLWRVELATRGHQSLCDAAALSSVTPAAFVALGEFLVPHGPTLASRLERQAIVRPTGIAGAIVAGYYQMFPPPYPYALFATRKQALAFLGHPENALDAADLHVVGEPLLAALRRLLARPHENASIDHVARALGVSTRSLQRRLQRAGTSFQAEARRAQIERAMELLATSDEKIATIAREVGCASLPTFSEMFAREVGTPPSAWRAAHRK